MANELKLGNGSFGKNKYKTKPMQPDFTGSGSTPTGEKVAISVWIRTNDKGEEFYSISLTPPYVKPEQTNTPAPAAAHEIQANDGDLPY